MLIPKDKDGKDMLITDRTELSRGCYDFEAGQSYVVKKYKYTVASYFFILDVGNDSVNNGILATACYTIKQVVEMGLLPEKAKVGFITYSDKIQIYRLKTGLSQPQMIVL